MRAYIREKKNEHDFLTIVTEKILCIAEFILLYNFLNAPPYEKKIK